MLHSILLKHLHKYKKKAEIKTISILKKMNVLYYINLCIELGK